MQYIQWKHSDTLLAGTTLRDRNRPSANDMALHTHHPEADILTNRKALCEELGIALSSFTFAKQTHSAHIHKVIASEKGKGALVYDEGIDDCDALYTRESGIAIGVFHADCVPVLLYDPFTGIIAAIHSGWQGTVQEITRLTLEHLMEQEGVDPAHIEAYIGPAIGFHSFEIGSDVVAKIQAMSFPTESFLQDKGNGKALADNKGLNKAMLLMAGVREDHITVNPNDTFLKNDAFFSYRRDHDCGRHLSFILRKD